MYALTPGVFVALCVAGLEIVRELVRGAPWSSRVELVSFGVAVLAISLVVAQGIDLFVARWLAVRAAYRHRRIAWTVPFVPFIVWSASHLFDGERAQRIPFHGAIAIALAGIAIVLVWVCVGIWISRPSRVFAAAIGIAAFVLDHTVLVRLYPWFHVDLRVIVWTGFFLAWSRPYVLRDVFLMFGALILGGVSLSMVRDRAAVRARVVDRVTSLSPMAEILWPAPHVAIAAQGLDPRRGALAVAMSERPRDVVLITIDALRADHVTPALAPTLSRFFAGGTQFSRAYSVAPHTSYALSALHTGVDPRTLDGAARREISGATLASLLKREGFASAAFYPPAVFFVDKDRTADLANAQFGFDYVKEEYLSAEQRIAQIRNYLDVRPKDAGPLYLWSHFFEPHEPYDVHAQTQGETARDRYAGEVRHLDAELARLFELLSARLPTALVVVAADHGEELGEHGGRYHGTTLYEEQVRIPLAFFGWQPGRVAASTVAEHVSIVDIAPTVLTLTGAPVPAYLGKTRANAPVFARLDERRMVIAGNDKLVCNLSSQVCELFDLGIDPEERINLIDKSREKAEALMSEWSHGVVGVLSVAIDSRRALEERIEAMRELTAMKLDAQTIRKLGATKLDNARLSCWRAVAIPLPNDLAGCDALDDPRLTMQVALLRRNRARIADSLAKVRGDHALCMAAIRALSELGGTIAVDALVGHLDEVRERAEVVRALTQIGDARALVALEVRILDEPYADARLEMVRALGKLGRDRVESQAKLRALAAREKEAEIARAIAEALSAPGR